MWRRRLGLRTNRRGRRFHIKTFTVKIPWEMWSRRPRLLFEKNSRGRLFYFFQPGAAL
jgi:hypothetical protein